MSFATTALFALSKPMQPIFHVAATPLELPVVFDPGRWGQQSRQIKIHQPVEDRTKNVLLWETTLELSRRIHRPDVASRFDCVFAFESLAGAKRFRDRSRPAQSIFEAEIVGSSNQVFRADITALDGDGSNTALVDWYISRSERYWTVPPQRAEDVELLCACPIRLVRWLGPAGE